MRKAIGMSGLLAAILAAGPVRAQSSRNDFPLVIMPDGSILTEQSPQIDQMRQLHRQITGQIHARISRELHDARLPDEVVEIPDAPCLPRISPLALQTRENIITPAQWTFQSPAVQTEKAAYMGIATGPVSSVLRDQLKLHRGMGLVVLYVEKGSPADQAGLLQNDVLEKLDDQLLVNTPQFTALVRAQKPGDEVTLSYIRAGKHLTTRVKLIEKEVPVLEDSGTFRIAPQFVPLPTPSNPGQQLSFGVPPGAGALQWQHGQRKTVTANPDGSTTRRLLNDHYDITLTTSRDNTSTLLVKDNAGHELFNAPYTTDADKQKLPPDLAPLVKDLADTQSDVAIPTAHAAITRVDAHHRITLQQNGPDRRLTVTELPSNKTLYDGPPDSPDIHNLPQDVQQKIQALEAKVHFGQ
ncbi:MAG: S1C family serine protease [Phycisphaerae bacterium]